MKCYKGVNPYLDTSKKMSGIFSLDAMMEATKGKEAYWVGAGSSRGCRGVLVR